MSVCRVCRECVSCVVCGDKSGKITMVIFDLH